MAWRPDHLVNAGEIDKLTDVEWQEQARQNAEEMNHFMGQLGDVLGNVSSDEGED